MLNELLLFLNIAPYSPGNEAQLARDMEEYVRRSGNSIVLYSLTMHPEGFPATEKAEKIIASYRKLKAELQGTDVKLGILFQSLIGHWPRTDKNIEPWTRTINVDGKEVRFCFFDDNFKNYLRYIITTLAKEDPCLILTDDDVRVFSPRAECFCPLHTAEFNRRMNTNFTSDALREAVTASAPGEPIYDAFLKLQRDTENGILRFVRECIDSVNPNIPAGSCCPGAETRFCGEGAKAIAGNHPPFYRMANTGYLEGTPKGFPYIILWTQQQRQAHKDIPIVLDEADTYPHNLYSRSSTSFHAKLCSSIMSGLNGAKLWYVNSRKQGKPISRNYLDILEKNKGYYPALAAEVKKTEMEGVVIPMHTQFPKWHLAKYLKERFVEDYAWAENILGLFGIPFQATYMDASKGIHAIATRETVQRFTDDELRQLLSGKLLVDGAAALELCKRGYADYLGLEATDEPFLFNREYICENKLGLVASAKGTPHIKLKSSSAEVLTMLAYEPYNQSGKKEDVAPGTVLFRNSLGGTIVTTSYHTVYGDHKLNPQRKEWLISLLNKLNGSVIPGIVLNEQDICCLRRKGDNYDLLLMFNLNFDKLEEINITMAGKPKQVLRLNGNGEWQEMPFSYENNVLTLDSELHCYEALTLKILY